MFMSMHMTAEYHGGQKWVLDHLKLRLQVFVRYSSGGYWELYTGPLQEQEAPLTLYLPILHFCFNTALMVLTGSKRQNVDK